MAGDGQRAGLEAAAREADARQAELLDLVLENNSFQRRRLEALDLPASPSIADLPPLTKRELIEDQAEHPPFGTNLTYPLDRYTEMWQTSGTTGRPLRVLDTAEDWSWWRRLFAHTLSVAGVEAGDRVGLAFSFGPHVQF